MINSPFNKNQKLSSIGAVCISLTFGLAVNWEGIVAEGYRVRDWFENDVAVRFFPKYENHYDCHDMLCDALTNIFEPVPEKLRKRR